MNEKLPPSSTTATLEQPLPLPPIDTEGASTYHITAAQVPLEFGGTLKSSKNNSNQQSPAKKSNSNSGLGNITNDNSGCYCTCFGGCGYGNRNRIVMPFWPAVLANLGICALLAGYIFIGSFLFLTIENSNKRVLNLDSNTVQNSAQMPKIIQQQQVTSANNLQKQKDNSSLNPVANNVTHSRNVRSTSGSTHHLAKSATTSSGSVIPEASTHINGIHNGETKMQHSFVGSSTRAQASATGSTLDYDLQTVPTAAVVVNNHATAVNADEDYVGDDTITYDAATTLEDVERRRTVENIWDITVSLNILYKENWTRLAALEIAKFQDQLVKRLVMDLTLSTANGATQSTAARGRNGNGKQQQKTGDRMSGLGGYERQRFWQSENTQQYNQRQQHWWNNQRRHAGGGQRGRFKSENFEWNFATAFLYSMTVITTVGYGTITARTTLGRMVTIGYATLGIPLTLIYLSSVGSVLAKLLRYCCSTNRGICCCCIRRTIQRQSSIGNKSIFNRHPQVGDRKTEIKLKQFQQPQQQQPLPYCYVRPPAVNTQEMEMQQHSNSGFGMSGVSGGSTYDNLSVATSVAETSRKHATAAAVLSWSIAGPAGYLFFFLIFYVTFGAVVIALLEDWPLIDGIYFCFMSLSTIGFCDLLPGIDADGSNSRRSSTLMNIAVWFCAVYILTGLTLTSMCVNLLHDEIASRMRLVVKFEKVHDTQHEQRDSGYYTGRS